MLTKKRVLSIALLSFSLILTAPRAASWCSPWLFWLLGGGGVLNCDGEGSSGGGGGGGW